MSETNKQTKNEKLLKVPTKRLESKAATYISRTQFGFRKGCGTREAIAVIRTLQERCLEHDQDAYVCYVDFEKAFDRVNWKILMVTLNRRISELTGKTEE